MPDPVISRDTAVFRTYRFHRISCKSISKRIFQTDKDNPGVFHVTVACSSRIFLRIDRAAVHPGAKWQNRKSSPVMRSLHLQIVIHTGTIFKADIEPDGFCVRCVIQCFLRVNAFDTANFFFQDSFQDFLCQFFIPGQYGTEHSVIVKRKEQIFHFSHLP